MHHNEQGGPSSGACTVHEQGGANGSRTGCAIMGVYTGMEGCAQVGEGAHKAAGEGNQRSIEGLDMRCRRENKVHAPRGACMAKEGGA
jgi:hypothetical protein